MGLGTRLREAFFPTPIVETTLALSSPPRAGFEFGLPLGGTTEYQQSNQGTDRRSSMNDLYEAYRACPWSSSAVNTIARTITAGGIEVDWDGDDDDGDVEAPPAPPEVEALKALLAYVNPRQDIKQLLRRIIVDLEVFGEAYLEVIWLLARPVALYTLDPASMSPIADEHGEVSSYVQITELNQRAEFMTDEVIHLVLDDSRSGLHGVSPTEFAQLPITLWLFCAATLKERFKKGDPPKIHVDHPASMAQTDLKRWASDYRISNLGPRNIGAPITTKGGAHLAELQTGAIEKYLAVKDQARAEILACYGVPPAKVGIIETGNLGGGTGEAQDKTFRVNTCGPIAELILEKLNFHLGKAFHITDWSMKFGEFDWRDSKIVEEIRDMRVRNGAWTMDRYRQDIGEPAIEGGDLPVLVDRQNLVIWSDMAAMSAAVVAAKAKGTTLDLAAQEPAVPPVSPPVPTPPAETAWQTKYRARLTEALQTMR